MNLPCKFTIALAASLFTGTTAWANPCTAAEYRQFDFWAGNWDAFDYGTSNRAASVRVDEILDGCVLRESYEGVDGTKGESFSIYDGLRKTWRQVWVTNRGRILAIEGKYQDGEMVLSGLEGATTLRGTWRRVPGGVRETGFTSNDGGKTWTPWFDLLFQPRK